MTNTNRYSYHDGLESARLTTRYLTEADAEAWAAFFDEPEAVAFIPAYGLATSAERAHHWIARQQTRYAEHRYGLQALIDKTSGQCVGQCGLLLQEVDGQPELEVGYHIHKRYWGQGYAPEAARLFIDYAFSRALADSVISIIDRQNIKSQRVAEKNGLGREQATEWSGLQVYIYRIANPAP